ncbi:hypothetical protein FALBO_4007 [Fusarium albosuccineum]|uniref:Uncharacterized protein n=1 Tax=Fusarium albosuccineum TaxID=1237068 RepID=A0A8H4PE22_9HYPO|nr:hypothetical protein FALBO_4007 [Fusarium albosuccineum]
MSSHISLGAAVPAVPVLLSVTGVSVGIYSFVSPNTAIRMFGLPPPAPEKESTSPHAAAFQRSVVYAYGIRNVGVSIGQLGLLAFWQFSPICRASPLAAAVTKRCLGLCMMLGTVVGLGDAVIIRQFAKDEGVVGEAKAEATKASINHAVTAVLIFATGVFLYL